MYRLEDLEELPEGPMWMLHNGIASFAEVAGVSPVSLFIRDGSRVLELPEDKYDLDAGNEVYKFTSAEWESVIVLRELRLSDRDIVPGGEVFETIEQLRAWAAHSLAYDA